MLKTIIKRKILNLSIQAKLTMAFVITTFLLLAVNLFMYVHINDMISQIDAVYQSNISLNELDQALIKVQSSMTAYLNTKTSDALEEYFRSEQNYSKLVEKLNEKTQNNQLKLMEKNIKNMSENYLLTTNQTVEAKRGRNVEKYKLRYEKASKQYGYISTYIYSLNNEQFRKNASNYEMLSMTLHYFEATSTIILIVVALCNIILVIIVTRSITNPLRELSIVANQVAKGDLTVQLSGNYSKDEIGVLNKAFDTMLTNIRVYISKIRHNLEVEREMKEKELLMETHLKDAQLKYLQAQINPHFLFNTLNAGAQLAMLEDAERTYEYIQNVALFFRYNIKKNNDIVTIREEIELVDNYIYILNVRFSGEIAFEKRIDETVLHYKIPSMILQPIVENCINYGIRDIDWQGKIILEVYQDFEHICISISDNGIGMEQDVIDKIFTKKLQEADLSADSNGIGLDNVIGRLRLFYASSDVFEIVSEGHNKGTKVIIYIPFEERE